MLVSRRERQKTKDKRQKTKDKRQKTKDKRQKTKDKKSDFNQFQKGQMYACQLFALPEQPLSNTIDILPKLTEIAVCSKAKYTLVATRHIFSVTRRSRSDSRQLLTY